jgi:hypothetical protein
MGIISTFAKTFIRACTAALAVCAYSDLASAHSITTFGVPGAIYTAPLSVSKAGIAGYSDDGSTNYQGFVRTWDGTITSFQVESSNTQATCINAHGTVTGNYFDSTASHGFVRAGDGTTATFDVEGSTFPKAINARGAVAGYYYNGSSHGFLRVADGTITTFDPAGSVSTNAWAINAGRAITGDYGDSGGHVHGFVRAADGTITTFDPSGSLETVPLAINRAGAITGYYVDTNDAFHGFLRAADGTISTVDPPGSVFTEAVGISTRGAIVGWYSDGRKGHGFVLSTKGKFASFEPGPQTETTAISGKNVTGIYTDSGDTFGFVRQ